MLKNKLPVCGLIDAGITVEASVRGTTVSSTMKRSLATRNRY